MIVDKNAKVVRELEYGFKLQRYTREDSEKVKWDVIPDSIGWNQLFDGGHKREFDGAYDRVWCFTGGEDTVFFAKEEDEPVIIFTSCDRSLMIASILDECEDYTKGPRAKYSMSNEVAILTCDNCHTDHAVRMNSKGNYRVEMCSSCGSQSVELNKERSMIK